MDLFSISQLGRYSGIKPHTIRIWEKRYNALHPTRSDGNTRYYDGKQLRRLLNIASLIDTGHKVSEVCALSDEQLYGLIGKSISRSETDSIEYLISQLIAGAISYDERHFDKTFSHCLLRFGLQHTYEKVLAPMLVRLGMLWSCDEIRAGNEHFITNLIRQKLFTAADSFPPADEGSDRWVLFLPEDEFHDIGLLFSYTLLRMAGKKVVFLGANVPLEAVRSAMDDILPDNMLLFLIHDDSPDTIQSYLGQLSAGFKGKKIYVAGNQGLISQVRLTKKAHWLSTPDAFTQILSAHS